MIKNISTGISIHITIFFLKIYYFLIVVKNTGLAGQWLTLDTPCNIRHTLYASL